MLGAPAFTETAVIAVSVKADNQRASTVCAMRDIHKEVTEQIIAELKTGVRPWVQPWSQTPGLNIPANAVTGRPYSGVNTLLLWTTRFKNWPQPRFLTFKQALETGGHVRKGEHGKHVVFVNGIAAKDAEPDEENPRIIRMLKTYTVFNIAQCDGLPAELTVPPKPPDPDRRDALIDEFIAATGAKICERDIENEARYSCDLDLIVMPAFKYFLRQLILADTTASAALTNEQSATREACHA